MNGKMLFYANITLVADAEEVRMFMFVEPCLRTPTKTKTGTSKEPTDSV